MQDQETTLTEDKPTSVEAGNSPVFCPVGRRVVISRKAPDVGGFKITKELERECSPDIGTIISIGQIGFWNKWVRGIRPGKEIHFVKYSPVKVETVDYAYIYVNVDDILGVSK